MGRPMFGDTPMPRVRYRGRTYLYNRFDGFFFLPVEYPKRKKERQVKEGTKLYYTLKKLLGV